MLAHPLARTYLSVALCVAGELLVACSPRPAISNVAGPTPALSASAPGPAPLAAPAPTAAPTADTASKTDEPTPTPSTAAGPEETHAEPVQSPVDVLTRPTVMFQIDYDGSAPRRKAEAVCAAQTNDDTQAMSGCLEKARDQFSADVLRFKKDPGGHSSLTIYKRAGSDLRELYKAAVELTEAPGGIARLKLTGREQGQRPLFKGRANATLTVPNEYSVELDDPQLGNLIYTAKAGLSDP